MGLLDILFGALSKTASTVESGMAQNANKFSSGYDYGSKRASNMTDDELRSSLRRAKEDGISDWNSAGKVRAMADEYKNRK